MPTSPTEAWRRYDPDEQRLTAHISERLLDLAHIGPGSRVLDIASGRGEPALRAAARVAPGGHVVGTDRSDALLDFARARAAASSLTHLHLVETAAETLAGVADHAFDAALCRWGLMFFDRPVEALQSARRCLKPGKPLVLAVWAAPDQVAWWSMPRAVLARHVKLSPPGDSAANPCRYAASETLRARLAEAGFAFEHQESLYTPLMEAPTPQGLVDWAVAFGLPAELADQPDAVRAAWHADMLAEAARYREPDGLYRLGGITRLVVARAT